MPSPYDILGTVFGALSLLGGVRCAYGFLKARQPFAQVVHLEGTLWATHQRIDELERHGYFERNPALVASYRSALKSINEESIRVRRNVVRNRPKTIAAVLAYAVQHGVNSKRSQRLRLWTKRVSLIRYQSEYPDEWPFGPSRVTEADTDVETALPESDTEGAFGTVVATASGMAVVAVPSATFMPRSHIPPHTSWADSMHHWVHMPIPKTVYGGVRLGAISILRRVQATWNRTLRPGSLEDAMPQDDSQDSEGSRAIVANRIGRGTEEANSTYNVSVWRGSLVPAVRGGNILRKANGYRDSN